MIVAIVAAFVLALSLCADCFAVSVCSSVTLKKIELKSVLLIAFAFGVVQAGLFMTGYGFGYAFVGYVEKIAHWIGFLLLLYVGGSMLVEALKGEEDVHDLNGLWKVIVAAVATSIDALAVGISFSMDGDSIGDTLIKAGAIFIVTIASVCLGMFCGSRIGRHLGRIAELIGGVVLILIGLNILIGFI